MATNNYTLGRGSLFFQQFAPGTQTPTGGERFFGDCNAVAFTFKGTDLDHYSSTSGVKELDASVPLQVDRTGSFTTENISPENLALFFLGSSSQIAITGATIAAETVLGAAPDRYYQLGYSATNPGGNRNLDSSVPAIVTNTGASTTYVAGTDYVVDYTKGRLYIVPGGAISSAMDLKVTYKTLTATRDHVVSGGTPIEGMLRFVSDNPTGSNRDAVVPWVRISPNGNFELIGDKFSALTFDMKILKKGGTGGEALYLDGHGVSA